MESNKRYKLCPHCEGRIDINSVSCPFCGRNISERMGYHENEYDEVEEKPYQSSLSVQQTLSSLYPPPYQPKVFDDGEIEEEDDETEEASIEEKETITSKDYLWPALFLTLGANLFFLSILMLFFSKNGEILLQWNAKYWVFYFLVSLPLFYFGYRRL